MILMHRSREQHFYTNSKELQKDMVSSFLCPIYPPALLMPPPTPTQNPILQTWNRTCEESMPICLCVTCNVHQSSTIFTDQTTSISVISVYCTSRILVLILICRMQPEEDPTIGFLWNKTSEGVTQCRDSFDSMLCKIE